MSQIYLKGSKNKKYYRNIDNHYHADAPDSILSPVLLHLRCPSMSSIFRISALLQSSSPVYLIKQPHWIRGCECSKPAKPKHMLSFIPDLIIQRLDKVLLL
jgi:hypothetical protein